MDLLWYVDLCAVPDGVWRLLVVADNANEARIIINNFLEARYGNCRYGIEEKDTEKVILRWEGGVMEVKYIE